MAELNRAVVNDYQVVVEILLATLSVAVQNELLLDRIPIDR